MAYQAGIALHAAILEGNVSEMMKILKDAGSENLSVNSFIGDYVRGSGQFLEPTALTVASENGQIECVRKILELGGKLYSVGTTEDEDDEELSEASIYLSEDYFGALVIAASKGNHEIVHVLAEFRLFKVTGLQDDFGEFLKVAKERDFQRISNLLDSVDNKDIVLKGWRGHNIINLCLLHGCPSSCVQTMIDSGIRVDGWDYNGLTPLMCAIIGRNLECVQFLLDKGADPYEIHIFRRLSFRDDGAVLYINDMGEEMNLDPDFKKEWLPFHQDHVGPSALMYAAAMGNIPILKLMLEAAPKDIGSWGRFERFGGTGPLMFAVDYANVEAVSLILNFDAAKDQVSEDSLCHAICDGNSELFNALLESKIAWSDWAFGLAILKCVHKKNSFFLSRILSCIEENLFEIDDGRALFSAIEENVRDCIDVFIKRPEFSVDMKCAHKYFHSACGLTGFMFSCRKGRQDLAKMFLKMGANVNAVDDSGKNAAVFAARNDQVESLKFLMDIVDFDTADEIGGTVFSAALIGNGTCLEVLIKTGKVLDKKGLKLVHKQSLKVFGSNSQDDGFGDYKKAIPIRNILLLMEHKIFYWEWCSMVDRKSLYNFIFAAVTSGISPGKLSYNNQYISPFIYAVLVKDVAIVRYLLANLYFLPDDYRFILGDSVTKDFIKLNDYPDLAFITEQLTLQPLPLQTWSALTIMERVVFSGSGSVLDDRNGRVDELPLPVGLKNILKSQNKFTQLCPRHWKRLGPQMSENKAARFEDIVLDKIVVRNPTMETCSKAFCLCGGQGLALKDVDGEDEIEDEVEEDVDLDDGEVEDFEFEEETEDDDEDE